MNLSNYLPNFDDMDKLALENTKAKAQLEHLKNRLEDEIARCIKEAMYNEEYWINNKPPSMSYAKAVISVYGNTEEDRKTLQEIRQKIVEAEERYRLTKSLLDNARDRISVWQTDSANKRKATL